MLRGRLQFPRARLALRLLLADVPLPPPLLVSLLPALGGRRLRLALHRVVVHPPHERRLRPQPVGRGSRPAIPSAATISLRSDWAPAQEPQHTARQRTRTRGNARTHACGRAYTHKYTTKLLFSQPRRSGYLLSRVTATKYLWGVNQNEEPCKHSTPTHPRGRHWLLSCCNSSFICRRRASRFCRTVNRAGPGRR